MHGGGTVTQPRHTVAVATSMVEQKAPVWTRVCHQPQGVCVTKCMHTHTHTNTHTYTQRPARRDMLPTATIDRVEQKKQKHKNNTHTPPNHNHNLHTHTH